MATEPPISALSTVDFHAPLTPTENFDPQTSPLPPITSVQTDSGPYKQVVKLRQVGEWAGPAGQEEGPTEHKFLQSYTWQLNNMGDTACKSSRWLRPYTCHETLGIPEMIPMTQQPSDQLESSCGTLPLTHCYTDQLLGCKPWDQGSESPRDIPLTFPTAIYSTGNHLSESHYAFQPLISRSRQDQTQHTQYPKPLYSYSILIFLALRHSQTGSLPVSEIYGFMTEHFPYFKTAPDGWKNSVRHNLSLNKCFEKLENRSGGGDKGGTRGAARGGASRKGCLWTLNPARVERMMEELQKWRRKDPLSVCKSMAHPEELECLLNDWTERRKLGAAHLPRRPPGLLRHSFLAPPICTGANTTALRHAFQSPVMDQQPPHWPLDSFIYHHPNSLDPPFLAHTTSADGAAQVADPCSSRNAQDGTLGSDIDSLRPSLTHLPLHGKLWEVVRDDSLAPESLAAVAPPSPSPPVLNPTLLDGYQGNRSPKDLGVTVTFAPPEDGASCLLSPGEMDMTLL